MSSYESQRRWYFASSGWPCGASTASALVCCCEAAGGEDNRLCYGMTWGIPTREPVVFTRLQGTQTGSSMPTTWIRTHSDRGPTPVMVAHVPFGRIVTAFELHARTRPGKDGPRLDEHGRLCRNL